MKKTFISLMLSSLCIWGGQAQEVGDVISYNGKSYTVVSENMIENPTFDEGLAGWMCGNNTLMENNSSKFNVVTSGGYDGGAYLIGTVNEGKGGSGSICMDWEIDGDKTYYFSYYIKRNTDTAAGTEGYVCASQSNKFCGDEFSSMNAKVDADCAWTKNEMLVENSQYPYLQFSARWLSSRLGFDGFVLFEVQVAADPAELNDLIEETEGYCDHFGYESSEGYEAISAVLEQAKASAESSDAKVLAEATKNLREALLDYRILNADDDNTVDVTERYVKNPYFDDGSANWDKINEQVNGGINVRFFNYFNPESSRVVEINGTPSVATQITQTIVGLPKGNYDFIVDAIAYDGSGEVSDSIGVYIMCGGKEAPICTPDAITPGVFTIQGPVLENSIVIGMRANAGCACTYVAFDNVRLVYHGITPDYFSDYLYLKQEEAYTWMGDNYDATLPGILAALEDVVMWSEEQDVVDLESFTAVYDSLESAFSLAKQSVADVARLRKQLSAAEELMNSTDYPGKEAFMAVYEEIIGFLESDDDEATTYAALLEQFGKLEAATQAYNESQVATRETPADRTYLVKNPNFGENKNYTMSDGWTLNNVCSGSDAWVGPCRASEEGGASRPGINNWSNNFTSLEVYQELTGLENGLYSISAELITQSGCANDQHVFATSSMISISSNALTVEGWDTYEWTTLNSADNGLVPVTDGTLRFGIASTSNGGTNGWWQATNVKLYYYGAYEDSDLADAWKNKLAQAQALTEELLPGDKSVLMTAIAAANTAADESYISACEILNGPLATAKAAAKSYADFKAGAYQSTIDAADELAYNAPQALLEEAIALVDKYLENEQATWEWLKEVTTRLNAYVAYARYADEVEDMLASNKKYVKEYKEIVSGRLEDDHNVMGSNFCTKDDVEYRQGKLAEAVSAMVKSLAYNSLENGSDMTELLIENADIDATTGWTFMRTEVTNAPTNKGQHYLYSGTDNSEAAATNQYLDSWKSGAAGALRFTAYQVLTDIPNGTYSMNAVARSDGDNVYLFVATSASIDTLGNITLDATAKTAMVPNYAATRGELWINDSIAGNFDSEIYHCNADQGWGWSKVEVENIEVTSHTLIIGITCDSVVCQPALGEYKGFTGTWLSADEFRLTLVSAGNNDGWSIETAIESAEQMPAITVVNGVISSSAKIDVYTLDGRRVNANSVLEKGVYIVRSANASQKVLVK